MLPGGVRRNAARSAPMTRQKIVFIDTETTGLHPGRRIWDLGVIVREPGKPDHEQTVLVSDVDLADADPMALAIGHFYDRHPAYAPTMPELDHPWNYLPEAKAALYLERAVRGATIVGAVPSFDETGGKDMLRRHGLLWNAHYHLMDVENLIVGYLRGLARAGLSIVGTDGTVTDAKTLLLPPWKSDALSRAIGIEPPGEADRHTAIGDARWCRRIWDAIMNDERDAPLQPDAAPIRLAA